MYKCAWKMTFPSGNALMLGFASSPQPTCTEYKGYLGTPSGVFKFYDPISGSKGIL